MPEQSIKKVYEVSDIQNILGLGRSKTYEFLDEVYRNRKPFNVIKIGKLYKVSKDSFDKWIDGGMTMPNKYNFWLVRKGRWIWKK